MSLIMSLLFDLGALPSCFKYWLKIYANEASRPSMQDLYVVIKTLLVKQYYKNNDVKA